MGKNRPELLFVEIFVRNGDDFFVDGNFRIQHMKIAWIFFKSALNQREIESC